MICFESVKEILDEIYERIPGISTDQKNIAIKEKIRLLEYKYNNLMNFEVSVDFENPATRFAYIFKYVTSHANIIYSFLINCEDLRKVFFKPSVQVTSLGSGPGSDVMGFSKYLSNFSLSTLVFYYLYDKELIWGREWEIIRKRIEPMDHNIHFGSFDVTIPSTWKRSYKYLDSDIFTMIYFYSELHLNRDASILFFNNLINKAKSGAIFIYADNKIQTLDNSIDSLFLVDKFQRVNFFERNMRLPHEEQMDVLQDYISIFGCPVIAPKVTFRVFRKI